MDIAVANVVIKNIKSEKIFMDLIQKVLLQERYFMQKVREAKDSALAELQQRAAQKGANAIVGIDLDYETVGANGGMLMVTVSGTAVVI